MNRFTAVALGVLSLSAIPAVTLAQENPLKPGVWPAKEVLRAGDKVKFYVRSNNDAYVFIFNKGPDNSWTLLYPNYFDQNNFAKGGQTYTIPSNFDLFVRPPFGNETVTVVAINPNAAGASESKASITRYISQQDQFPSVAPRTLVDKLQAQFGNSPTNWGASTTQYQTAP